MGGHDVINDLQKIARAFVFVISLIFSFKVSATSRNVQPKFQDGDIVLQTSQSYQSQAIQLATHSKWSHVGIIFYKGTTPYVYEARGPVGFRSLKAFVSSGVGGKYLVRRLKQGLSAGDLNRLYLEGQKFLSKPYDIYFEWTSDRIYCSELVWKMYQSALGVSIGALQNLGDFDLSSPEVKKILAERYGTSVPYGELVISPEAIATDTLALTSIYQN
jgi:hypothetical protein